MYIINCYSESESQQFYSLNNDINFISKRLLELRNKWTIDSVRHIKIDYSTPADTLNVYGLSFYHSGNNREKYLVASPDLPTALGLILKEVKVSDYDKLLDTVLEYDNLRCLE